MLSLHKVKIITDNKAKLLYNGKDIDDMKVFDSLYSLSDYNLVLFINGLTAPENSAMVEIKEN